MWAIAWVVQQQNPFNEILIICWFCLFFLFFSAFQCDMCQIKHDQKNMCCHQSQYDRTETERKVLFYYTFSVWKKSVYSIKNYKTDQMRGKNKTKRNNNKSIYTTQFDASNCFCSSRSSAPLCIFIFPIFKNNQVECVCRLYEFATINLPRECEMSSNTNDRLLDRSVGRSVDRTNATVENGAQVKRL